MGIWDDWQAFGECSSTCGKGLMSRSRFLKSVAIPPTNARMMLDGPLADQDLERKIEDLHMRSLRMQANCLQVLGLASAAGMLTMVAALSIIRMFGRKGNRRYGQMPEEARTDSELRFLQRSSMA